MITALVLDDDDARHSAFAEGFARTGIQATHAHTYDEAVQALKSKRFDICLLDHDLNFNQYASHDSNGNELSGADVATFIAALPADQRPQIIHVHSKNENGAKNIESILLEAGIPVQRAPYGGEYASW